MRDLFRGADGTLETLHRGNRGQIAHFLSRNMVGSGICFFGRRGERPDGTYTTTRWYTLFFIPIIPVGSYEVKDGPDPDSWYVLRRVPLPVAQRMMTILMLLAIVGAAAAYFVMQRLDAPKRGAAPVNTQR